MTQEQLEARRQRAERELFVITTSDAGWHVRSAVNPKTGYLVVQTGEALACNCPDFQSHAAEDPGWQCKHVLAVDNHLAHTPGTPDGYEAAERAAIQQETTSKPNGTAEPPLGQMLVKRSLSPDGRIDSISIEFSFLLNEATATAIKARAQKALQLQTEIVRNYLGQDGKAPQPANGEAKSPAAGNGASVARILDVGVSNGQYGERFFLNVDVNGRRARLFGTPSQIVQAVAAAGQHLPLNALQRGLMLNLPCRVLTETSRDGRYLNVTQVLPPGRDRYGQ